jgi:hypothetical protein
MTVSLRGDIMEQEERGLEVGVRSNEVRSCLSIYSFNLKRYAPIDIVDTSPN